MLLMWNTNTLIIPNSGLMSLTCVADMVLDHQEASNELDDSVRVRVREALLKRHHHQNEKKKNLIPIVRSITEGARKQSEPHLIGEFDGGCHTSMSYIKVEVMSWYKSDVEISVLGFLGGILLWLCTEGP